jgi:hypothetical protein
MNYRTGDSMHFRVRWILHAEVAFYRFLVNHRNIGSDGCRDFRNEMVSSADVRLISLHSIHSNRNANEDLKRLRVLGETPAQKDSFKAN